jgi:hypothetical protein
VLVAVTPALLVIATALALAAVGSRRSARALGWLGIAAAWLLLALFLKPGGIAAALASPLLHGWVVVGVWQIAAASAASAWSAWCWRPTGEAARAASWPLRVALAMILPMCVAPPLLLACEPDLRGRPWQGERWRRLRIAVVLASTIACWWIPAGLAMAVASAAVAATVSGPWRLPAALACLAALASLRSGMSA